MQAALPADALFIPTQPIPMSLRWECMTLFTKNRALFTPEVCKGLERTFKGLEFTKNDRTESLLMRIVGTEWSDKMLEELNRQLNFFINNHDLVYFLQGLKEPTLRASFEAAYPGLKVILDDAGRILMVDVSRLGLDAIHACIQDIVFFRNSPTCPPKYIFSKLGEFSPKQKTMLACAQLQRERVIRGLFLSGEDGMGKMHIAVGVAKCWVKEGWKAYYVSQDRADEHAQILLGPNQIWVFPRFNASNMLLAQLFQRVVWGMHTHNGLLVVTSDKSYEQVMQTAFCDLQLAECCYRRRADELFGYTPIVQIPQAMHPEDARASYPHEDGTRDYLNSLFKLSNILTSSHVDEIQRHYPGLQLDRKNKDATADPQFLTPEQLDNLILDIVYFITYPGIAVPSLCSQLENFNAQNAQQLALFATAKRLAEVQDLSKPCGFFMQGIAASGKSHIAIGIGKKLFKHNSEHLFHVTFDQVSIFEQRPKGPNQVWILDDFHFQGQATKASALLLALLANCHAHGGILIVTSTFDWKTAVNQALDFTKTYDPRAREAYLAYAQALFTSEEIGLEPALEQLKVC